MKLKMIVILSLFILVLLPTYVLAQESKWSITSEIGVGIGTKILGSNEKHSFVMTNFDLEYKLSNRWSGVVDLFYADQFHPNNRYLSGGALLLRYNFKGEKWIPFINAGAGMTLTNIGKPDLGGTTQFNVQGGAGMHYFFRKDMALTGEYRFFHVSSAGIHSPNFGTNSSILMLGVTWLL